MPSNTNFSLCKKLSPNFFLGMLRSSNLLPVSHKKIPTKCENSLVALEKDFDCLFKHRLKSAGNNPDDYPLPSNKYESAPRWFVA